MIQKINNTSFKGIYPVQSIERISADNLNKLQPVIAMSDNFPMNDIFLGRSDKNELTIEVREKELLGFLLEPEINKAFTEVSTEELIGAVGAAAGWKEMLYDNHPEKTLKTKTNNMNKMSPKQLATAVAEAVFKFNQKIGNKPN